MNDLPQLPSGYEFHHLGYATDSIARERGFLLLLGYRQDGEHFEDTLQGIAGCFMTGVGPRIELLANLPGCTTLDPWLAAGIKVYHFAYLVSNVADAVAWARTRGGKQIVKPTPAAAFDDREVAFVVFRNRLLIEFINRPTQACSWIDNPTERA